MPSSLLKRAFCSLTCQLSKSAISCKGHAGMICCCLCVNATLHNSASIPVHLLTDRAVSISNTSLEDFIKHTDESIRALVQRVNQRHEALQARMISQQAFDDCLQVLGWNWTPSNIILNERFRFKIASMVMYGWAHIYVRDGLADNELGQAMKTYFSNRSLTSFRKLGEYVATFTFPKRSPNLAHLFTASANANSSRKGSFSCTGSEFLTLTPVVHRYFTRVVASRGEFMPVVSSMIAVLNAVMLLMSVRSGTIKPQELCSAIAAHLLLYKAYYGDAAFRPKHRYSLHLPGMLLRFGFLLAAFTHERKHRLVTRYTRDRKNLRNWDAGAIEEITCHQMWELKQPFFLACATARPRGKILYPLREMFPGVDDDAFVVVNDMCVNGGRVCAGDVVSCLVDGQAQLGELLLNIAVQMPASYTVYSVIALWQSDPNESTADIWRKFRVSKENVVKLESNTSIDTVFTYRMAVDQQTCVVYFPPEILPKRV
ncbi:unnamed protein product [Polarella glacialis]|uniref:Uncharacterized protein n=1 Tax=Polarella glacialis TaxID=89957 RepID=A0A813ENY1_POLGL|nr:unnamed protein product [Polarella glacialis]